MLSLNSNHNVIQFTVILFSRPVKDLLANRVKSMKLKENFVQCFPAEAGERIHHFFGIQQRIDPLISLDNMNDATTLPKTLRLNSIHVSNKEMYRS